MGGALPIHIVLAISISFDLERSQLDIACAQIDGMQKYIFDDGYVMYLAHIICMGFMVGRSVIPLVTSR